MAGNKQNQPPQAPAKPADTEAKPQGEGETTGPITADNSPKVGQPAATGAVEIKAGQNEPTPSGVIREPGAATNAPRPDDTTQQPRTDVGGRRPEEAFPDRPDQGADPAAQAAARTADAEAQKIDAVRERAQGTGVFRVTGSISGGFEEGRIVAGSDLPKGTDFQRLVRLKALEPLEEMRADPNRSRAFADHPQMADDFEDLHNETARLRTENDTLRKDNVALRKELAEARRG